MESDSIMKKITFAIFAILMAFLFNVNIVYAQEVRVTESSVSTIVQNMRSNLVEFSTKQVKSWAKDKVYLENPIWDSRSGEYRSDFTQAKTGISGSVTFIMDNQNHVKEILLLVMQNSNKAQHVYSITGAALLLALGLNPYEIDSLTKAMIAEGQRQHSPDWGKGSVYVKSLNRYISSETSLLRGDFPCVGMTIKAYQ